MTLEEFIKQKEISKKPVLFGEINGFQYAISPLRCGYSETLNLKTGQHKSYHYSIKKFKLINSPIMFIIKEQVIKAYKQGSEEIKQLLLTLFENQFQGTELELLKKEDEIANLKKQLENCGK